MDVAKKQAIPEAGAKPAHDDHSINVCFSTTNQLISKFIRWRTKSDVSHACITFHSLSLQKIMVMEAVTKGYVIVPWDKWKKQNVLIARYRLNPETIALDDQCKALESMGQKLGLGFDFAGLLDFLKLFWRGTKVRFKNEFQNPKQLFCSEAVAEFLTAAGLEEFKDASSFRPDILRKELRGKPKHFRLEEGCE